ncbi:MAG TPA: DJ-1/PfpI family protein [Kofleriaceae bacterium]|jgi:cyclohexyl-isocyanide hydratase|nr:DJ-1/PfpI family protein [Kofleriaceae bacterium]
MQIAMLLFPKLTQLDLTGPHEVLARIPGATVHLVARSREPVVSETGLAIVPTATFDELPRVDLVFVPGGFGQIAAADDAETIGWLRAAGATARWITSVCTGALLLGAAGLLDGYHAATHWAYMDLLPLVGATPEPQRVVVDRNRITGGGVTAGIDVALRIAAEVSGREVAEQIQLQLEYDPHPPFGAGHPDVAPPALVARTRELLAGRHAQRKAQLEQLRAAR